jgi:hypothetical protein
MSAFLSLTGVKRTFQGKVISVAIDPLRASALGYPGHASPHRCSDGRPSGSLSKGARRPLARVLRLRDHPITDKYLSGRAAKQTDHT